MKSRALLTVLLTLVVVVPSIQATTYIVPEDRELIEDADAIAVAEVVDVQSHRHPLLRYATTARLRIIKSLKGNLPPLVDVTDLGGVIEGEGILVSGGPGYVLGERAIVFLKRAGNEWRTFNFGLGKFTFSDRDDGVLVRMAGECGFTATGERYLERARDSQQFTDYIELVIAGRAIEPQYWLNPIEAEALSRPVESNATDTSFLMQSSGTGWRRDEFDSAQVLTFHPTPPQAGISDSTGAVDRGGAAWTNDSASNVQIATGGQVSDTDPVENTESVVIFNYPGTKPEWASYPGAVGIALLVSKSTYTRPGTSTTFISMSGTDIVIKAGFTASQSVFDAVVAHEIGHCLGFRHSNQDGANPNLACSAPAVCTTQALMNSVVGGSGAVLQSWDAEAVSTVYGAGPVCTAPAITAQPQSVTINAGEQTTLSVVASGTAPTFRWYQGTAPSTSVPLGTQSTQTVSPSATTNYWVRVSGCSQNVDSNTVTVTVTCNPPSISGHPQSVTIQEGQQTTLSVTASAGSTFQWFIGASAGSGTPVSGATSSSISVSPTTTTSYWVRVTACSQTLDSNVATVTVTCAPPHITQQPQSRSILAGGTANLSVVATGSPFLTYQWYQGTTGTTSTPLGTSSSINVSPTVTTSYWVRVSGACAPPADSATATVTVSECESITIFQQPQPKTVLVNQKFTLEALHTGSAPFTYQWYRGVRGSTSNPVPGATGAALQTTVAVTTSFWVRIGNCGGTIDSESATVTVTSTCVNPSITGQPAGATIFKGQSATLTVVAGGTNPAYQWFQGTAPGGTAINGATSASVTVTPTATTSYWVRVTACNQNVNSQTVTVTVSSCPTGKLCTHQKRFELSLAARDQRTNKTAAGVPLQENDIFGFFALPELTGSTDNPEVFVKVIDARAIPGNGWWVFYGGLTDLEFTLTVDDKQTGAKEIYKKDPGSFCGGADTGAFAAGFDFEPTPLEEPIGTDESLKAFVCGANSLCLLDGRFDVRLSARDQRSGRTGTGVPLPKNNLFGYFALPELTGSTQNPEVFVKMLDARAIGSGFWVFYGGLTDLEYTLTIKDQSTGAVKQYRKDPGSYCGGADTGAFPPN